MKYASELVIVVAGNGWQKPCSPHLSHSGRSGSRSLGESLSDVVWASQKRWSSGFGRLFGIELRTHLSLWILVAVAFGIVLARTDYAMPASVFISIGVGLLMSSVLFGSILVHGIAHANTAEMLNKPVKGIMLHPLGGITLMDLEASPGRHDVFIYLSGPVINLAIAGVLSALTFDESGTIQVIARLNRDIGIFNLLPIFPLDGSKVLREMLMLPGSSQCVVDRITLNCSRVCCAGVGVYGFFNRELTLVGLVLLLWWVSRCTLSEDSMKTLCASRGFGESPKANGRSVKNGGILALILVLPFISPRETACERDLRGCSRQNPSLPRERRLLQPRAVKGSKKKPSITKKATAPRQTKPLSSKTKMKKGNVIPTNRHDRGAHRKMRVFYSAPLSFRHATPRVQKSGLDADFRPHDRVDLHRKSGGNAPGSLPDDPA